MKTRTFHNAICTTDITRFMLWLATNDMAGKKTDTIKTKLGTLYIIHN